MELIPFFGGGGGGVVLVFYLTEEITALQERMYQGFSRNFVFNIKRIQANKSAPTVPATFKKPTAFGFVMISGATEPNEPAQIRSTPKAKSGNDPLIK